MLLTKKNLHPSAHLLIFCGIWLIGLGIYSIIFRPPLLSEDARYISSVIAHIKATLPGIESWLKMVFTVMGGFMAGAGVLTLFLAIKMEHRWSSLFLDYSLLC